MDFSQALKEVKHGSKIAREGWNAADQFVYYVPANTYPAATEIAEVTFRAPDTEEGASGQVMVPYTAYLAIKTVQNTVAPWLPSQTDVLADDWKVVD